MVWALISREQALELVKRYLEDDRMVKHCLAVEAIMRGIARILGEDEVLWGLVGLLHDIDYDYVGRDLERHGLEAMNILNGLLPDIALEAIAAHNENNGYRVSNTLSEKIVHALRASDHVSGLIVATALVMPSKKLADIRLNTLVRKFKSKDFARGVDRDRIREIELLGIDMERFMEIALESMKVIADELGL